VDECAGDLLERVVFADIIDLLNDQNMCAPLFCLGFFEQANVDAVNLNSFLDHLVENGVNWFATKGIRNV
jgi:hypothetical protein